MTADDHVPSRQAPALRAAPQAPGPRCCQRCAGASPKRLDASGMPDAAGRRRKRRSASRERGRRAVRALWGLLTSRWGESEPGTGAEGRGVSAGVPRLLGPDGGGPGPQGRAQGQAQAGGSLRKDRGPHGPWAPGAGAVRGEFPPTPCAVPALAPSEHCDLQGTPGGPPGTGAISCVPASSRRRRRGPASGGSSRSLASLTSHTRVGPKRQRQSPGDKDASYEPPGPPSPAIPGAAAPTDGSDSRGLPAQGKGALCTVSLFGRGEFRTEASRISSPRRQPEPKLRATQGGSRCLSGWGSPRRAGKCRVPAWESPRPVPRLGEHGGHPHVPDGLTAEGRRSGRGGRCAAPRVFRGPGGGSVTR